MQDTRAGSTTLLRRRAMNFILLLGLVSFFADVTFEGAHSIIGPYLGALGASSLAVGFFSGLGDFFGYSLQTISGFLAARTGRYWTITFLGYFLNLLAAPLLALAGRWEVAALLIVLERLGMVIRTPARDSMLSHATTKIGHGWGFGIHEAMDQIGSILGPLFMSMVLYLNLGYAQGFMLLAIPAGLAILCLVLARANYPSPKANEAVHAFVRDRIRKRGFFFWLYAFFTAFSLAGFADFTLISFHFSTTGLVPSIQIPIFFAIAMGVEGIFSLFSGRLYERFGIPVLLLVPFLTIPIPFLVFSQSYFLAILGILVWGASLGLHESILRTTITDLVPISRRGASYGVFSMILGLALLLGNTAMGGLYAVSISSIGFYVLAVEGFSLLFLWAILRQRSTKKTEER